MTFNGKHTGRVVQFLAEVLADALEGAAAWAVGIFWLVMNQCAWKLCRQSPALGRLLFLGRSYHGLQALKLSFNRSDVGVYQIIEQASLLGIHLFAALGKLQTFELGDLKGQLLDQRFVLADLLAHEINGLTHRLDLLVECRDTLHQLPRQGAQLFRGQMIEIG